MITGEIGANFLDRSRSRSRGRREVSGSRELMETKNEIQEKVLHSELIKGSDHDKETGLLDAELKVVLTNRTLSNDGDALELSRLVWQPLPTGTIEYSGICL